MYLFLSLCVSVCELYTLPQHTLQYAYTGTTRSCTFTYTLLQHTATHGNTHIHGPREGTLSLTFDGGDITLAHTLLQHALDCNTHLTVRVSIYVSFFVSLCVCVRTLHFTATHCNTHIQGPHEIALSLTLYCNTLQHTVTHIYMDHTKAHFHSHSMEGMSLSPTLYCNTHLTATRT